MLDRISLLSAAEDACPICGYWRCRCTGPAVAVVLSTDSDPDMDEALRRVRAGGAR